MAKTLFYDLETSYNEGAYFQLYREGNILFTTRHWHLLSFAYKWLGEKTTHVKALPDYKTYKTDKRNDVELVKDLWGLFNQADIIVAHNGNAFDSKKSLSRFIFHGLKPPTPYKQIDTKLVAKRYFRFDSNKLDDLADFLGVGRKLHTGGVKLWQDCINGDLKAWNVMKRYNKQDVVLLEKIYMIFRPYITVHPNIALLNGKTLACPNCGSENIVREGYKITRVNKMQQYRCKDCGAWGSAPVKKNEQTQKITQVR
ncbi:MAG: ribonuclease H-like domain-containing protein [Candidatus Omnitrophota bacterium]